MYRNYKIKSGELERYCWLDRDDLKVGTKFTLKKDYYKSDRIWEVIHVFETTSNEPMWRTWRVGGLQ